MKRSASCEGAGPARPACRFPPGAGPRPCGLVLIAKRGHPWPTAGGSVVAGRAVRYADSCRLVREMAQAAASVRRGLSELDIARARIELARARAAADRRFRVAAFGLCDPSAG